MNDEPGREGMPPRQFISSEDQDRLDAEHRRVAARDAQERDTHKFIWFLCILAFIIGKLFFGLFDSNVDTEYGVWLT